jgi:hypothetical protein
MNENKIKGFQNYFKIVKDNLENNENFLKNEGKKLLELLCDFYEYWEKADNKAHKVANENSAMRIVIESLWFPQLFYLTGNLLIGALDSMYQMLRFLLEGLEIGLILDCTENFKSLSVKEKLYYAENIMRGKIIDYLENLIDNDTLDELEKFYGELSSKWLHVPGYLKQLIEDTYKEGFPPARALYFAKINERVNEFDELMKAMESFNKLALKIIKYWESFYEKQKK